MQRIILSIIFGILFPSVCVLGIVLLASRLPPSFLFDARIFGISMPGLLFAPFALTIYVDIFMENYGVLPDLCRTMPFRISALVLYNRTFYATLIYLLLGRLKRFKNSVSFSETPPAPPVFEED